MSESIFIQTLQGEKTSRPPVWFMRQAGRCLPSYMKLRETYSFMELMENPELASKVTLLPVHELGVDAAILFSDILVIPQALGLDLVFTDDGPRLSPSLKNETDALRCLKEMPEKLSHVYKAIEVILEEKPENIPLIGFCGGPLTVMCYMVEGLGTDHSFPASKDMITNKPELAHAVLRKITNMSKTYVAEQCKHGIQAFQLFETWAGLIDSDTYIKEILPYSIEILQTVKEHQVPVIFFPRGFGNGIEHLNPDMCNAVGIDQGEDLTAIREKVHKDLVLQGNINPELFLKPWEEVEKGLQPFGMFGQKYNKWICNLGHGVLPSTDSIIIKKTVDWLKAYDWKRS
jgi:uroporphyrinogen decarboxylase